MKRVLLLLLLAGCGDDSGPVTVESSTAVEGQPSKPSPVGYDVECVNGTLVSGFCALFVDTNSSICSCNLVGDEAVQRCKALRAATLVCP